MNAKLNTLFGVAMVAIIIAIGCSPTPSAPLAPPVPQQPQFALEAPANAKVVKAFSKMDAACLGKTEWTIEVTPDAWIDVGTGWFAKNGIIAQENWKHLSYAITLDGKEIKDLAKYFHGPKPFKLECPDSPISAEIVALEIFAPPLPVGDHKVTWKTTIESDLNDGFDDYKKGTVFDFTGMIHVSTEAAQVKGTGFPIAAFGARDQSGNDYGIEFKANGSYATIVNDTPVIGSFTVNETHIAFKDNFCRDREGTYNWKLDSTGLNLKAVDDRCMERKKTLEVGAWTKKPSQ